NVIYLASSCLASFFLTSLLFLVLKYQSIVVCTPSKNFTFGSHPKSFFASLLLATLLIGPVGIWGNNLISALWPAYLCISATASKILILSIVPKLTALPSSSFS